MSSEISAANGSIIGAYGSILKGNEQSAALDRSAAIARNNAALEIQAGELNASISAIRSQNKMGAISAGFGAGGVASDSGSALSILAMSESNAELDRQNIMHGAKVRAINYENQARADEIGSESALKAGYMNAFSSLMMAGTKSFGNSMGSSTDYESVTDYGTAGAGEGAAAAEGGEAASIGGNGEWAAAFI